MPRKCKICGQMIPNSEYENSVPYQGGFVHKSPCFEEAMKALVSSKNKSEKKTQSEKKQKLKKPKAELKDAMSDIEYKSKKAFYDYIHSYLDDKIPAKVYVLATKFIDQYGFDYDSMKQTLVYIREILQKEIDGDGVGLIPYYIDEAKEFYKSVDLVAEQNKDMNISEMYQTKIIKIKPKTKEIKQLDITDIVEESGND